MDPVPFVIASVIAGALVTAVIALWRMAVVSNKKCEERNTSARRCCNCRFHHRI